MFEKKISKRKIKSFNRNFNAFEFGKLQDFNAFLHHMERKKLTVSEFKEWIAYRQNEMIVRQNYVYTPPPVVEGLNQPSCPYCALPLLIYDVNTTNCNQVGGDLKAQLICRNIMGCGYERYSVRDPEDWVRGKVKLTKAGEKERKEYFKNLEKSIRKKGCGGHNKKE